MKQCLFPTTHSHFLIADPLKSAQTPQKPTNVVGFNFHALCPPNCFQAIGTLSLP
jgi:hypothetical protein